MHKSRWWAVGGVVLVLAAVAGVLALRYPQVTQLLREGDARRLRPASPPKGSAQQPQRPGLLVLALDGVRRDVLYGMLREGALPGLSALLGGRDASGALPHAYFAPGLLATLPASTSPGWSTVFSGVPPAVHGVAGNEFFVREQRRFVALIPISFQDLDSLAAVYTQGALNRALEAPTLYQQLRAREPGIRIWVAMSQVYQGADRLLLADRGALVSALTAFIGQELGSRGARAVFEAVDEEVFDNALEELKGAPRPPDLLTLYVSGTDQYAHVAKEGPVPALREYLREVVDPLAARLARELAARDGARERYVVVTADHGHSDVRADARHALLGQGRVPAVLRRAGFRVRPFGLDPAAQDFQAVLAYQGALAYVYLADRSTCARAGERCAWERPPRLQQEVLAVAEAFLQAGRPGGALAGTLDLVLARAPRPPAEQDLPCSVYVGKGRLVPVEDYLRAHPRPRDVALAERLRDLAVGPLGERAGDVLLLAHQGEQVRDRFYFSAPHQSGHGSASREDSEVPLIVAHPALQAAQLAPVVEEVLGPAPQRQQRVTPLLLRLREAPLP